MSQLHTEPAQRTEYPVGRPTLVDPESFVFWLLAVTVAFSGLYLVQEITSAPGVVALPAIGWLSLVEWTIYAIGFLSFVYHHQLFVRRSPLITLAAFAWGGVVSTWFAARANAALGDIFTHLWSTSFHEKWGASIAAASNEELLKATGLLVLVLLPRVRIRSTLDGWFYGTMIGLGFQVVEDYIFTVQQSNSLTEAVGFVIRRGFYSGLWAHAVYTGIVGAGVGYLVSRRDRTRFVRVGVFVALFAIAWLFHFAWDLPGINDWFGDGTGAFFLVILFKGVPALATLLFVVRRARVHERTVWSSYVHASVDRELVSEQEIVDLLSRHTRRAACARAASTGGSAQRHRCKALQRAQLAYVQAAMEDGTDGQGPHGMADEIRSLKAELDATPSTTSV
jgi:RsiW-degrading membrane proteinase PrsW (M82 family)